MSRFVCVLTLSLDNQSNFTTLWARSGTCACRNLEIIKYNEPVVAAAQLVVYHNNKTTKSQRINFQSLRKARRRKKITNSQSHTDSHW